MLSKDAILELYLNAIYLGRGAWGAQMAAQTYFGKDAAELNVAEAALLAGMAKGPTYYSPDRHPDRARERTAYVLNRMRRGEHHQRRAIRAGAGRTGLPRFRGS